MASKNVCSSIFRIFFKYLTVPGLQFNPVYLYWPGGQKVTHPPYVIQDKKTLSENTKHT